MAMNEDQNLDELQAVLENYPVADRSMVPRAPAMAPPAAPEASEAPAGNPSIDDQMKAAQDKDNKQMLYANLLRSFQTAIQGAAPTTGFKADMGVADGIAAGATAEKNLKAKLAQEAAQRKETRDTETHKAEMDEFQLKLKKANLDFQDMQANNDPTSAQSKIAQDRVIEKQKEMGQPVNEAQIRQQSEIGRAHV